MFFFVFPKHVSLEMLSMLHVVMGATILMVFTNAMNEHPRVTTPQGIVRGIFSARGTSPENSVERFSGHISALDSRSPI